MAAVHVSRAGPDDDADIRDLLRRPMDGMIQLSITREPDASVCSGIEGDRHAMTLVRNELGGELYGMCSRSARRVYWNGEIERVGYISALRAKEGRMRLRRLLTALVDVESTRQSDELPFDLANIVEDNEVARRLFERGLRGVPRIHALTRFTTHLIPTRRRRKPAAEFTTAHEDQLPAIADCLKRNYARFQFAPIWELDDLKSATLCPNLGAEDFLVREEAGTITACAAIWDQRPFKQIVINGYATWLARVRPLVNLGLLAARQPRLPRAGTELPLAYLSHIAVDDDDTTVFLALLREARSRAAQRGIDYLTLGFAEGHELGRALARHIKGHTYRSLCYAVVPEGAHPPEMSGIVHVETATL